MAINQRFLRPLRPRGTPASLLLRFNGADASTDFVDSSPNNLTVTANGDAQISTAQSKFGGASGYFDGDGDYCTVPDSNALKFGSGDGTIEFWMRPDTTGGSYQGLISKTTYNSSGWALYQNGDTLRLFLAGASEDITTSACLTANAWSHVAVVKNGNAWTIYANGISVGTAAKSISDSSEVLSVGEINTLAGWNDNFSYAGYIDDLRIVKGLAVYTGPFIPPTQQLSAYATPAAIQREASLLLHFNGDDESTVFTDSSVNALTVTANSDAEISTAQSKFGGASGYFDGTSDTYAFVPASAATALNGGDFCIEFWGMRVGGSNAYATAIGHGDSGVADDNFLYCEWTSSYIAFGAFALATIIVSSPSDNEWHHLAFTRSGNTIRFFIDGVLQGSSAVSGVGSIASKDWYVGAGSYSTSDRYWNGYIDDLRIVKGLAVYTGPFTPPTAPLSAIATPKPVLAQVSLLLHFDGTNGSTTFTDSSQNALSVTASGDAQISTAESKFGSGSGAFDGDGDYLQFAYSNQFDFASTDWTIEFWAKFNDVSGSGGGGLFAVIDDTDAGFVIEKVPGSNSGDGNKLFFYSSPGTFIYGGGDAIRMDDTDAWYHCAITREGDTVRVFVNGVLQASGSCTPSLPDTSLWPPTIAAKYAGVNSLDGFMDDFRIVMGRAVYTANFAPPTAPLSATVTPL